MFQDGAEKKRRFFFSGLVLFVPASGGTRAGFHEPLAAARASLGNVLVAWQGAAAIETALLEGALDEGLGHSEGALEGLFEDETADALA